MYRQRLLDHLYSCSFCFIALVFLAPACIVSPCLGSGGRDDLLIEADQLRAMLNDEPASSIVILDTRSEAAFAESRVPNAIRVDVGEWKAQGSTETGMMDEAAWTEKIQALGIAPDTTVIVYDDVLPTAARLWWHLKFAGCNDVRVLNGGFAAWKEAALALESGASSSKLPTETKSGFQATLQRERYASKEDVLEDGIEATTCQIMDARTRSEYEGSDQRGKRAGHIPNARNLDWQAFVTVEGKVRPDEELRKLFVDAGFDLDKDTIGHCQSGGRSSAAALIFEVLTGKPMKNYYGSWGEYSQDLDLPIVTGPSANGSE